MCLAQKYVSSLIRLFMLSWLRQALCFVSGTVHSTTIRAQTQSLIHFLCLTLGMLKHMISWSDGVTSL